MNNQSHEDMDIVEANLIACGIDYQRIAPSVILVKASKGNREFSQLDISIINQAFDAGNEHNKLQKYCSEQIIVIYEKWER